MEQTTGLKTCVVLGSPLAVTDYSKAVEQVFEWAEEHAQTYAVAAANTHVVAMARHRPEFRRTLDKFDLLLPDGMPLIWCMNRFCSAGLRDRVYGPTFMLRCLKSSDERFAHFLLGGSDELLVSLQEKIRGQFPHLRVAGVYAPPFGQWPPDENARIIEKIRQSGAEFVWVGLGCPKQENWIAQQKAHLPGGVYVGVGAAFAFHSGRVRQAPMWMQQRGLEWAFRLATEPSRLWKRYLSYNSLFLFYLVYEALRRRSAMMR